MKKKNKKRFKVVLEEPGSDGSGSKILEDRETGVVYLYYYGNGGAGLTVLLDDEGKPAMAPEK
ncbi:MAG: DUF6440 family protein [Eubacteriaceae bacterium]|nr:DUF6440 family protein [Eubacteriaceae bacterium]MDD4507643.1 DUF6440 family protein [Eubacteriaceae bacterium]